MNEDFDIDIDKIFDQSNNIKPITEGLGFHHSLKEEKEINLSKKSKVLENEISHRARHMAKSKKSVKKDFGQKAVMGDLSAFYETELDVKEIKPIQVSEAVKSGVELNKIGIDLRVLSFLIDMLFVSFIFISIFAISFFISGLPENVFLSAFFSKDFLLEGTALFSMIFVFYFSFFDKTTFSTLGKNLLGLRVSSTKGKMTYYQSVIRSVLTLVNIATCGTMNLLGVTDIISKTKLVKE